MPISVIPRKPCQERLVFIAVVLKQANDRRFAFQQTAVAKGDDVLLA